MHIAVSKVRSVPECVSGHQFHVCHLATIWVCGLGTRVWLSTAGPPMAAGGACNLQQHRSSRTAHAQDLIQSSTRHMHTCKRGRSLVQRVGYVSTAEDVSGCEFWSLQRQQGSRVSMDNEHSRAHTATAPALIAGIGENERKRGV